MEILQENNTATEDKLFTGLDLVYNIEVSYLFIFHF